MTRRAAALAEAAREIRRLELEGMGLFLIAELYRIPVRRHGSRYFSSFDTNHLMLPEYLQGQPGTLTLGYLQEQLADQVEKIWDREDAKRSVTHLRRAG
tara:strand:- start:266 stop:562 length:297 start_codon:yes stop_codon:yes gene_type:complete